MRKQGSPIDEYPSKATIWFAGKPLNLCAIGRAQNLHNSYLSRVFSGNRYPSVKNARKIAAALGMGLEEFLKTLDGHVEARALEAAGNGLAKYKLRQKYPNRTFAEFEQPERLERLRRQLLDGNTNLNGWSAMDKAMAIESFKADDVSKMEIRKKFPGRRKGTFTPPASNSWVNMMHSFLKLPKPIQEDGSGALAWRWFLAF